MQKDGRKEQDEVQQLHAAAKLELSLASLLEQLTSLISEGKHLEAALLAARSSPPSAAWEPLAKQHKQHASEQQSAAQIIIAVQADEEPGSSTDAHVSTATEQQEQHLWQVCVSVCIRTSCRHMLPGGLFPATKQHARSVLHSMACCFTTLPPAKLEARCLLSTHCTAMY